jgi:DNA polymerase I-like protein with 3'-5' exonuclease and polymerase domains
MLEPQHYSILGGSKKMGENNYSPKFERDAVNTLIQGTGADICKSGMLAANKYLRSLKGETFNKAKLIHQIHDELVFHVPTELTKDNEFLAGLQDSIETSWHLP